MYGLVDVLICIGCFLFGVLIGGFFSFLHRKELNKFIGKQEDRYNDLLDEFSHELEKLKFKDDK